MKFLKGLKSQQLSLICLFAQLTKWSNVERIWREQRMVSWLSHFITFFYPILFQIKGNWKLDIGLTIYYIGNTLEKKSKK